MQFIVQARDTFYWQYFVNTALKRKDL